MPAKGGKKNRKYLRNKPFCERYAKEGRRERNKAKKLKRHMKKYPDDQQAAKCLKGLR